MTLARTIWLPDDGPRTETCRRVFNILMCKFYKFYICAVVGIIIEKILMKFDFSVQIFKKYTNIKYNENPFQWETSCSMRKDGRTDRQTDRHDGTHSRFSEFCEGA